MAYCYHIEENLCKGCGLCVSVCPKNVLEPYKRFARNNQAVL